MPGNFYIGQVWDDAISVACPSWLTGGTSAKISGCTNAIKSFSLKSTYIKDDNHEVTITPGININLTKR